MSKIEFKEFVKNNPRLLKYVNNNEMSWQKFYEMYDMYGDNPDIWKKYLNEEEKDNKENNNIGDFVNYFKNINLDTVQESINSIQRVLGVLGEISANNKETSTTSYEPKPIYKHFDD